MKYRYVFWDWNGTLLDDAYAAHAAVNAMLKKRKLPLITFEQYREFIDVPIVRFYEKVMDISNENMESLSAEFNGYVGRFLTSQPLAIGVGELLSQLHSAGVKQFIFSSSQNKFIEPYLERFDLAHCFEAVLGASDCYVGSKVERTSNYIKTNNISPNESVFIGDMVHDSDVASEIGSECILVSSGHQSESALLATGREVVRDILSLTSVLFS